MVRRLAAAALVVICGSASARAGSRHHRKLRSRLLADACPADSLQHAMPPHVHYTGKFDIGMRDFVVKDGKWPDHAKFFYELLAADFAYTVEKPTSKLKATYFSLVSAALKKKPPPDPFSDEACTSVAAATAP